MRWGWVVLACLAGPAQAAEPPSLDVLAAPLLKARTYCESGNSGASIGANEPLAGAAYRVCAHEDGRFKYVQNPGEPGEIIFWSDNRKVHRYVTYGRGYQSYDARAPNAGQDYGSVREPAPALHSRLFRWATRTGAGLDLAGSLRDYRINAQLSDDRQLTYERFDAAGRAGSRIRVNAADGAFLRLEGLYDGVVRGFVEVTAREVDRPLTDADLSHEVPITARYSLSNNAPVFVAGLYVAAAVIGFAFWSIRFSVRGVAGLAGTRRRLWRWFAVGLGVVAALLVLLAGATWGGSGHPPAIVYVFALAVCAAVVFGLAACFLLTSYLAEVVVRRTPGR